MADVDSRLSSGNIYYKGGIIGIEKYRNMISARNLFNLNDEYKSTTLASKNNVTKSISSILNVIPQYNRIATSTNLLTNAVDAYGNHSSELSKIGIQMLGKQIAYNSANNLATQHLPSVDLSQVAKGNIKGVFKKNIKNTITVESDENKSTLDKVAGFANKYLGIRTYDALGDIEIKNITNLKLLQNTGDGQLTHHFGDIAFNVYKPITEDNKADIYKIAEDSSGNVLLSQKNTASSNNITFFNFDRTVKPYFRKSIIWGNGSNSVSVANSSMLLTYSSGVTGQEYAPTYQSIVDNFGKTTINKQKDVENWVNVESNITTDDGSESLVWGRDGVVGDAVTDVELLRGDVVWGKSGTESNIFGQLKAKKGLLEYTRNLLNATNGNFVDITKKVFKDGEEVVGFQGSPLWRGNNSNYSQASGNANKTGIRQHTVLDPYGSFPKSIRFKGNYVYGGSENSVINRSVLPRIHPTKKQNGEIDNKNLMFSLENLAVGTIKREAYGVIDDEYATAIPLSEVGSFGGRLMWFPPYDIQINEVAIAKYESTVMVGRNEPMYNYMNSERTANLNFTLLIDYPEQLRNINLQGENKNKAIADFFAFGGDSLPIAAKIDIWEKQIKELEDQKPEISGPTDQAEPAPIKISPINLYFQNNAPSSGQENIIINSMYNNPNHYEILNSIKSAQDGNGFGLNKSIYFLENMTGKTETSNYTGISGTSDQYNAIGRTNQDNSISQLNENLYKVYSNVENRKYYSITITAGASKLYLSDNEKAYNEALGDRRVKATAKLVRSRLKTMFPELNDEDIEIIEIKSAGSAGSSDIGAEPKNIHLKEIKEERSATIAIARNSIEVEKKSQKLNQKQKDDIAEIDSQINTLQLKIKAAKKNEVVNSNVLNERNKGVLNGYNSISGNKYYPAFHSQTPEDFHRRLTFLHQCTRQGAAKRYDVKEENGILRARNSVFGKQPICVLRVGDFFYTKVIIENITIDYNDTTWDMNPEGFSMQPMIAKVTLQMKIIGGQSLKGPIDALQNAVTFNYYANSDFTDIGMYSRPAEEASNQASYNQGILTKKNEKMTAAYLQTEAYKTREGEI